MLLISKKYFFDFYVLFESKDEKIEKLFSENSDKS